MIVFDSSVNIKGQSANTSNRQIIVTGRIPIKAIPQDKRYNTKILNYEATTAHRCHIVHFFVENNSKLCVLTSNPVYPVIYAPSSTITTRFGSDYDSGSGSSFESDPKIRPSRADAVREHIGRYPEFLMSSSFLPLLPSAETATMVTLLPFIFVFLLSV
jgi:hypothetical protein